MAESHSFPADLAECHRLMVEQQALLAAMEQQRAEQVQRYGDLEQVLDRTAKDLGELREEHQKVIDEVRLLRRWVYGSRRERHVPDARQQHLFDMGSLFAAPESDEEQVAAEGGVPEDAAQTAAAQEKAARRRRKRAERKLCLDALPQIEHYHDISDEEKICNHCGREKTCIGEDISRMLDYLPGQLEVHNHHNKTYACTCGKCGITTAVAPPKPIEKCIAGPGLLSSLIVSKTGDHLPIYRSEDILVRHGLHIPRSTLCDWMHRSALLLLPLVAFMTIRILRQNVLWTDDTSVLFFDRNGKPVQSKNGESMIRRGRFWPYIARGDAPYTVFDFTVSRDRDGPMSMLSGWSGYLHADAYSGYDPVIHRSNGLIIEVACWAHARRYFEQALDNDRKICGMVLEWVRQLYDIEDRALLMSRKSRTGILIVVYDRNVVDRSWWEVVLVLDELASGSTYQKVEHRFLNGPQVDQVFSDQNAMGEILWYLQDAQQTVRDVATWDHHDDDSVQEWMVVNHLTYDAFGNLLSADDPTTGTADDGDLPGTDGAYAPQRSYTGREPDPGGRLGDADTRAKSQEVVDDLVSRGFIDIDTEVPFRPGSLGSGKKRFADVVGRDPIAGETEIIQIGRTIKSDPRVPIIRERHAWDDIIFSPDIRNYPNTTIRFVDVNRPGVIQP